MIARLGRGVNGRDPSPPTAPATPATAPTEAAAPSPPARRRSRRAGAPRQPISPTPRTSPSRRAPASARAARRTGIRRPRPAHVAVGWQRPAEHGAGHLPVAAAVRVHRVERSAVIREQQDGLRLWRPRLGQDRRPAECPGRSGWSCARPSPGRASSGRQAYGRQERCPPRGRSAGGRPATTVAGDFRPRYHASHGSPMGSLVASEARENSELKAGPWGYSSTRSTMSPGERACR